MTWLKAFLREDGGAVAVDWIIMTAATVALTLALAGEISDLVEAAGLDLAERLISMPIRTSFDEWEAVRTGLEQEGGAPDSGDGGS